MTNNEVELKKRRKNICNLGPMQMELQMGSSTRKSYGCPAIYWSKMPTKTRPPLPTKMACCLGVLMLCFTAVTTPQPPFPM